MNIDVTVSLPEAVSQRAQVWAEQAGRTLPDFLAEAIELSLLPLGVPSAPVDTWTDEEVLQASQDFLAPDDDRHLSELLVGQREDSLDVSSRAELFRRMQQYQDRLARKAVALREAVRRGLREPLAS
jgi:predicted DNA-binding protein